MMPRLLLKVAPRIFRSHFSLLQVASGDHYMPPKAKNLWKLLADRTHATVRTKRGSDWVPTAKRGTKPGSGAVAI